MPYWRPSAARRLRLFCIPHAGAGASTFQPWVGGLGSGVEICAIQLPGRENRLDEDPYTQLAPLVERLARVLAPLLDDPFALYGHSLGALIAFELVRHLRREHGVAPLRLFASAHRAPHLPYALERCSHLGEDEFISAIRALGTTPSEVFEHVELRDIVLPALRADFALAERYSYVEGPPLDCPISVLGGRKDQLVTEHEVAEWRHHTSRDCVLRIFPGDHSFPETARESVLQAVAHDLVADLDPGGTGNA